ncbi:hypothetical protein GGI52_002151 [Pseudomonas moraviensis]|uniref:Uncharacterized protein n=1 Tax=Pseudomonas moraviensis TaxID=321662 RepID=A0A7Z0ATZ5_9PSED|nr:hypothetical protein [Pseudomonas moraviensis]
MADCRMDGNTFSLSNKPDSRLFILSGVAADT